MVPRWIVTVAGRVDPQCFAEMTPLRFVAIVHVAHAAVTVVLFLYYQ